MNEINVREAKPQDADAIARVHIGTWQGAYRGLIPDEFLEALSVEKRAESWKTTLEDGDPEWPSMKTFAGELGGRVVGFSAVGPNRDVDESSSNTGELYAIYVDPECWDESVGAALMVRSMDELRKTYRYATLWVIDGNVRARRFYERFGWSFDGTTKDDESRGFVLREVRYRIEF